MDALRYWAKVICRAAREALAAIRERVGYPVSFVIVGVGAIFAVWKWGQASDVNSAVLGFLGASVALVLLWVIFFFLGLCSIPAAIDREKSDEIKRAAEANNQLQEQLDIRAKRKAIREALGKFLSDGQLLMGRCADEEHDPPNADADHWAAEVETFLSENFDNSFIARFRDGSDLPMTANSIVSIPHRTLWGGIRIRVARLQQFIKECN